MDISLLVVPILLATVLLRVILVVLWSGCSYLTAGPVPTVMRPRSVTCYRYPYRY